MSWWGKLLGGAFGLAIGGPVGALLGAAIGHNFDKGVKGRDREKLAPGEQEQIQSVFFTTTFSVMGHIAKIDGRVSEQEIGVARAVMTHLRLTPDQRQAAITLFRQGKQPGFSLDKVLDQFQQVCRRRSGLLRMFMEIQLNAAYADGILHERERTALLHICDRLGFPRFQFEILEAFIHAQRHFAGSGQGGRRAGVQQAPRTSLIAAYTVLGLQPEATDEEVKKAYRRLINQHHPDKLVAKGLSEQEIKQAADKTHEIRVAYERIKEARGL